MSEVDVSIRGSISIEVAGEELIFTVLSASEDDVRLAVVSDTLDDRGERLDMSATISRNALRSIGQALINAANTLKR